MTSLVVRGERVVLPDGVRPASIHIRDGLIAAIGSPGDTADLDAGPLVVLPGLVDSHVHINEPGRTDWEGFATATRAAAAGGVTTLIDMPLNSIPPTTTVEGLRAKRSAADGRVHVDVAFWGGVVPGNTGELEPLARAGVRGFKCFLCPSGVDEFEHVTERDLREALPVLSSLGLPLLAHAELPEFLEPGFAGDPRAYTGWLRSRPPAAEHAAIELLIRLAREYGVHVHVVHLASAGAVLALRQARDEGVRVTVETCPHYLSFAAENIADGRTEFKCAPPIRERAQQNGLWKALVDGDIDLIATDHSPAPPSTKCLQEGDFTRAWGGIASLQLGLASVWTAARERDIPAERLARWMSDGPARLAGLDRVKGAIAVGCDGDLVLWDPEAEATIDPAALHHRHPVTPYAGLRLRGAVRSTLLRGQMIYADGEVLPACRGRMIGSAS